MTTMTTYKKAIAKLAASNLPVIISNDDIILLKGAGGYSLIRNDVRKLVQTRYKTVRSINELEDEWMDKNDKVEYKEFKYDEDASFYFRLVVTASTHRDITL